MEYYWQSTELTHEARWQAFQAAEFRWQAERAAEARWQAEQAAFVKYEYRRQAAKEHQRQQYEQQQQAERERHWAEEDRQQIQAMISRLLRPMPAACGPTLALASSAAVAPVAVAPVAVAPVAVAPVAVAPVAVAPVAYGKVKGLASGMPTPVAPDTPAHTPALAPPFPTFTAADVPSPSDLGSAIVTAPVPRSIAPAASIASAKVVPIAATPAAAALGADPATVAETEPRAVRPEHAPPPAYRLVYAPPPTAVETAGDSQTVANLLEHLRRRSSLTAAVTPASALPMPQLPEDGKVKGLASRMPTPYVACTRSVPAVAVSQPSPICNRVCPSSPTPAPTSVLAIVPSPVAPTAATVPSLAGPAAVTALAPAPPMPELQADGKAKGLASGCLRRMSLVPDLRRSVHRQYLFASELPASCFLPPPPVLFPPPLPLLLLLLQSSIRGRP